jgi:hypothetical protein
VLKERRRPWWLPPRALIRLLKWLKKRRPTARRCWRKMGHSDLVLSPSAESTGALLLTRTCYSNSVT